MQCDVEKARVREGGAAEHPTLFPAHEIHRLPKTPQSLCQEIGLNWWAAGKLFAEGWLSFDPQKKSTLTPQEEAELVFVGSLVGAGCDAYLMSSMLSGLRKPYAYDLGLMYYDWRNRTWRLVEDGGDIEAKFEQWMQDLVETTEFGRRGSFRQSLRTWQRAR